MGGKNPWQEPLLAGMEVQYRARVAETQRALMRGRAQWTPRAWRGNCEGCGAPYTAREAQNAAVARGCAYCGRMR